MKAAKFLKEVTSEAKKVSWSSLSETRMLTIIVTIVSILIATYILVIDNVLESIVNYLI